LGAKGIKVNQANFSESFRRHAVQKMFSRGQRPVDDLAKELGCSTPSLYKWAKSMKLSSAPKHVSKWSPMDRISLVAHYNQLSEGEKGAWLRANGLTGELVDTWAEALVASLAEKPHEAGLGRLRKEVRNLEHQLRRKEDKLRQSVAIIDAQKKILELFEDNPDESQPSMNAKS
jgi:transposase